MKNFLNPLQFVQQKSLKLLVCGFLLCLFLGCDPPDGPDPGNTPLSSSFTFSQPAACPTPCQICFTNTSQGATSYRWDFGNGQSSLDVNPCVSYSTRGTYTVTLTALQGNTTVVSTRNIVIGDNIERYRRTFAVRQNGEIRSILQSNGSTYLLLNEDSFLKMIRFNSSGESYANIPPGNIGLTTMIRDTDGGILLPGTDISSGKAGLVKLNSAMFRVFQQTYNTGVSSEGFCVVPKNTNNTPGYIMGTTVKDASGNYTAHLLNTYRDGTTYFSEPVEFSYSIKRIFKNAGTGTASYVTFGEWTDPLTRRLDIEISTVNENGVDYLPTRRYLGLGNAYNDAVTDAVQFNNGTEYAAIGVLDNKPTFFAYKYDDLAFSPPVIVQGFSDKFLIMKSVCALANNSGFAVCGTESDGTFGGTKIFLAKIDNSGRIAWRKRLGGISSAFCIVATADGGMLLGGQEYCANLSCNYPVLYKLDPNGDFE